MNDILNFLTNAKIVELASDPRVLIVSGALFVLSLLFRWKFVAALLFGIGGTIGVMRYANMTEGQTSISENLVVFGLGTVIVAGILIYFLFIRSD